MPETRKSNLALSIDKAVYLEMQREADLSGISLNTLVNQVLNQYVSVYRVLDAEKCMSVPGSAFSFLLEICDESQFSEIVKRFLFDTILLIQRADERTITLEEIVEFFEGYGSLLGWYTHFEHYKDSDGYTNLVFGHNHDSKWSKVIGIAVSDLIEKLFHLSGRYLPSPSLVTVKILTQ